MPDHNIIDTNDGSGLNPMRGRYNGLVPDVDYAAINAERRRQKRIEAQMVLLAAEAGMTTVMFEYTAPGAKSSTYHPVTVRSVAAAVALIGDES